MDPLVEKIAEEVKKRLLAQTRIENKEPKTEMIRKIWNNPMSKMKVEIAAYIDHTLLKPDASREELHKLCEEALKHHFTGVCVNSSNLLAVAEILKGSCVKAIAVVGFPLGASTTAAKAFEAKEAVSAGANEIDMVINIGALKDRAYKQVLDDIKEVVHASSPAQIKVILETALLTDEEKIIGCVLSKIAGAHFVKTSTGFGPHGATIEDVKLMRRIVGPTMGVKASGGIKTYRDAIKMIEAGATRIGTSSGVCIVTGERKLSEY